jgi:diguanylate cyclase (GGDEF)-like protein
MYTYLIMVSVLAVATDSFQQHPRLMWRTTILLVSTLLARLGLIIGRPYLYLSRPALWRWLLALTVVIIASCCGLLHAAFALMYGIESWPFLISAIWIAGLTAGGCLTFVPSMALVYCHLFLMEMPILLVCLRLGGTKANAFALTVLFFIVFLIVQCRQLHSAYWQGLADRASIEAKNRLLEELALTDALTGLPNRRAIGAWSDRQLEAAARHGFAFWVVLMDIDHFKGVNDTYGHEAGDAVLQKFGEILKASTRASEISGRIGGEEFLQVITFSDQEGVRTVTERIRKQFAEETFHFAGRTFGVTASFGASGFSGNKAPEFSALVGLADIALYRAKNSGRNRIEIDALQECAAR